MSDDYGDHLAARHHAWTTPTAVIADLAAAVTNETIVDIRRIVEGEANEVLDVTLRDGSALIVRISHGGPDALERETWVLGQCAARDIRAPRVHSLRYLELEGDRRTAMVMDKVPGERLSDLDLDATDLRRVLEDVGTWLSQLHSIPVEGFGYLDGAGVGAVKGLDEWLAGVAVDSNAFEEAGGAVGLGAATVRSWVREIVDSFHEAPPRVTLIHNDLLARHVMVHDGRFAGVIDFGEAAAEPAASDFAKWDFTDGDRFPVQWLQRGYGDPSLFEPPHDRTYRAIWLGNGLWRLRWYHETGFRRGMEEARDRLLAGFSGDRPHGPGPTAR